MSDKPQSNPAVVGLAGFGGTTLLLQFHNLGLCGAGSVFWAAIFFGGLMQLIAGLQEFKTGNNFGYAAFSTYGAFWLALGGCLIGAQYGILKISTIEIGWFLVVFTLITIIFFIGTLKQNGMVAFLFLTLLLLTYLTINQSINLEINNAAADVKCGSEKCGKVPGLGF